MSTPTDQYTADCPQCGSTEISYSRRTGMLVCEFCRSSWQEASAATVLGAESEISSLRGTIVSEGADWIDQGFGSVITLKCQGCGAEVLIDSARAVQARCHWCRSVLSLDSRVPNGAVPDAILPFAVPHEHATALISGFFKARWFFAHPQFKLGFAPQNVAGVFMPYFIADVNADVAARGVGEILRRRYTVKQGKSQVTYYDADAYDVIRETSVMINDLHIESSSRRNMYRSSQSFETGNIINSILPFDTNNAVKFNASYLGFSTSEKRDLDVTEVSDGLARMVFGTATTHMRPSLAGYGRGVSWAEGMVGMKGIRFSSLYAPLWLYSHYERHSSRPPTLHYIAVNARTGAINGSIPINRARLNTVTALICTAIFIPLLGIISALHAGATTPTPPLLFLFMLTVFGFAPSFIASWFFRLSIIRRYRNESARYHFENASTRVSEIRGSDTFIKIRYRMHSAAIAGQNDDDAAAPIPIRPM